MNVEMWELRNKQSRANFYRFAPVNIIHIPVRLRKQFVFTRKQYKLLAVSHLKGSVHEPVKCSICSFGKTRLKFITL